jgi:hypothetical protein
VSDPHRPSQSLSFLPDTSLPFFCGSSAACRQLGGRAALTGALARLQGSFAVVTVLERLEDGLEVLECRLPEFFKVGAEGTVL